MYTLCPWPESHACLVCEWPTADWHLSHKHIMEKHTLTHLLLDSTTAPFPPIPLLWPGSIRSSTSTRFWFPWYFLLIPVHEPFLGDHAFRPPAPHIFSFSWGPVSNPKQTPFSVFCGFFFIFLSFCSVTFHPTLSNHHIHVSPWIVTWRFSGDSVTDCTPSQPLR